MDYCTPRSRNTPYEKIGDETVEIEVPFDIPDSWEWCRLVSVNDMYTGNSINETEKKLHYTGLAEGHYYIGTKDVGFDHVITYDNGVRIPYTKEQFRIAPRDSIILCIEGGSAGRKIAFTNQDVCFGNKLCCFVSFGIDYKFLYFYLQSPLFQATFKENTTGIIGGVSVNTLKAMLLPVPPLEEQKRIVSEIEKYEPLLEQYDDAEQALSKLNSSFPEQLKKSILQWAVQGKLVPQDPSDEPAEILLERIRGEKERLVREGKIKKDKHESVIFRRDNSHYEKRGSDEVCIDDEIPFEIPENWTWARLSSASVSIADGDHQPPPQVQDGIPFLVISNVSDGRVDFSNTRYVPKEYFVSLAETRIPKCGDLLFTVTGSYGIVIPVQTEREFCFQRHIALIKLSCLSSEFMQLWLSSPLVYEQCRKAATGTAQKTVGLASLKSLLVPIPPLTEQERIVQKLNTLLALTAL